MKVRWTSGTGRQEATSVPSSPLLRFANYEQKPKRYYRILEQYFYLRRDIWPSFVAHFQRPYLAGFHPPSPEVWSRNLVSSAHSLICLALDLSLVMLISLLRFARIKLFCMILTVFFFWSFRSTKRSSRSPFLFCFFTRSNVQWFVHFTLRSFIFQ